MTKLTSLPAEVFHCASYHTLKQPALSPCLSAGEAFSYSLVGQPCLQGRLPREKNVENNGQGKRRKKKQEHSILGNTRRAGESRVKHKRGIK